jgi:prepilin-type N-terminal cleavage/methylation domain-containing protein
MILENFVMTITDPSKRQEGFTLPEVMVALIVLCVALLGMAALTGSIVRAGALSRDRVEATTLAQSKIEELKNTGFSSMASGNDSQGAFTRTWTVSAGVPAANATTIVTTVSWAWAGATRTVVLRTIRSE